MLARIMLKQPLLMATQTVLIGRVDCSFNFSEIHSFRLYDLGPFIKKKGEKKEQKIHTFKNNIGNQIEINHSFPNAKRKVNIGIYGVGHSSDHLCLSGADSDSDKEAADMGCDH
ncbi:hypothetical protein AVEN_106841-1 [Araneus ventricosus]|uniref:Uncharacterized protein n=1 Tax=Araneus ventricosus TaxID=182803 RepID=A0A4Y2QFM4_ARAVE|nr:hypothetical protein AVEN_106841-1 [Araneus ventricosus]